MEFIFFFKHFAFVKLNYLDSMHARVLYVKLTLVGLCAAKWH